MSCLAVLGAIAALAIGAALVLKATERTRRRREQGAAGSREQARRHRGRAAGGGEDDERLLALAEPPLTAWREDGEVGGGLLSRVRSLVVDAQSSQVQSGAAKSSRAGGTMSRLRGFVNVCGGREEGCVREAASAGSEDGDTAYVAFER